MTKSVLVTGASSGIGLATVLELAGAGWQVHGSVRSAGKAELVQAAAADRGVEVATVLLDVDDPASCARAVAEVEERSGGLGALVNNAGFAQSGAVEDVPDELVRAQLETNLVAPVRLARLVLPGMRARGGGRIVNVSSVAGRLSAPLLGWYCASKHGLEAVTDALRMEVEAGRRARRARRARDVRHRGLGGGRGGRVPAADDRHVRRRLRPRRVARAAQRPAPRPGLGRPDGPGGAGQPGPAGPLRRRCGRGHRPAGRLVLADALSDYVKTVASGLRRTPLRVPFLPR